MKGDDRSEAAMLGLGANVRIVDVNQRRVRLSRVWSLGTESACGLGDFEMEARNGWL
jgi:hypothetical protein